MESLGVTAPEARLIGRCSTGLIEELRPNPVRQQSDDSPALLSDAKPRVLVVEDNPDMNRLVSQSLSVRLSGDDADEDVGRASRAADEHSNGIAHGFREGILSRTR